MLLSYSVRFLVLNTEQCAYSVKLFVIQLPLRDWFLKQNSVPEMAGPALSWVVKLLKYLLYILRNRASLGRIRILL
jgi:hypothetical protein